MTHQAIKGPAIVVRYTPSPSAKEYRGTLVRAEIRSYHMALPQIVSVTVHGPTGMVTLPHGTDEWADVTLSPGQLNEDSYRAVCAACGVAA